MDIRKAFLDSATTILAAFVELANFRIVGNTAEIAILSVNVIDHETYKGIDLPAIKGLRSISPTEYSMYSQLFNEASLILAYAWLDALLSDVEEAMYLHDPSTLGENVQIKLGKVLGSESVDEIVHDIARRKVREKGMWGLRGRLSHLQEAYTIEVQVSEEDVDWVTSTRNALMHDRRIGQYSLHSRGVTYRQVERRIVGNIEIARRSLTVLFQLSANLYTECARILRITRRFPRHRANMDLIERLGSGAMWQGLSVSDQPR